MAHIFLAPVEGLEVSHLISSSSADRENIKGAECLQSSGVSVCTLSVFEASPFQSPAPRVSLRKGSSGELYIYI